MPWREGAAARNGQFPRPTCFELAAISQLEPSMEDEGNTAPGLAAFRKLQGKLSLGQVGAAARTEQKTSPCMRAPS